MTNNVVHGFVDTLLNERTKEAEKCRGAFDKGVDTYFRAMSGLHYRFDESLQVEVNNTLPEFVNTDGRFDAFRLKSYFRGINASMDISSLYALDDKLDDAVRAYDERVEKNRIKLPQQRVE